MIWNTNNSTTEISNANNASCNVIVFVNHKTKQLTISEIVESAKGIALKYLHPKEKPEVSFTVSEDDVPLVAYELCNIHGLWKKNS